MLQSTTSGFPFLVHLQCIFCQPAPTLLQISKSLYLCLSLSFCSFSGHFDLEIMFLFLEFFLEFEKLTKIAVQIRPSYAHVTYVKSQLISNVIWSKINNNGLCLIKTNSKHIKLTDLNINIEIYYKYNDFMQLCTL